MAGENVLQVAWAVNNLHLQDRYMEISQHGVPLGTPSGLFVSHGLFRITEMQISDKIPYKSLNKQLSPPPGSAIYEMQTPTLQGRKERKAIAVVTILVVRILAILAY